MAERMTAPHRSSADDLLDRAMQAAQQGRFDEARKIAGTGLHERNGPAVPFLAFLGMIEARCGNHVAAAGHLRRAHRSRPLDMTIACNLISSLVNSGRHSEALAIATPALMQADGSLRIARFRGFLAQECEQFEAAARAYEFVLARQPLDFECLNNLGNALAGLGDNDGAAEVLQRALTIDSGVAPTWLNLAAALSGAAKYDDAERVLDEACRKFPQDSYPPFHLYKLHKAQLRHDEGLAALQLAAQRDPDHADYQLKLGIEYGALRQPEAAEKAYRRAIALDPSMVDAYLGLAIQFEHTNREAEFAPLADRARKARIAPGAVAFIETLELRRAGKFEQALAKLAHISDSVEPIRTAHIRASLLDRLNRFDEAFAAQAQANALMAQSPTEPLARARTLREQISREIAVMSPAWRESWRQWADADDGLPDPVFLVGFPRSGTTLLDTFLMGHPATVVMEEQPPLNRVEEQIGGLDALPCLDRAGIGRARAQYFEEVAKIVSVPPGAVLIDKSPLFLYRLPLIRRLFPNSRIILALRHPCDAVLSCWMSNFQLNSAMANFLQLEDTAEFYDLCFHHWETSRSLLDGEVYSIAYEHLVENAEDEMKRLVEWLGLEWTEILLDHRATAKSRGLITTASYSQVIEPIYGRASGRWLRYREHLSPVLETLAPWAEKLGYGDPRRCANHISPMLR